MRFRIADCSANVGGSDLFTSFAHWERQRSVGCWPYDGHEAKIPEQPWAEEAIAAIIRITGGNFRLLNRLLTRVERITQDGDESFAETIARALGVGTRELRNYIAEGRIGSLRADRFKAPE